MKAAIAILLACCCCTVYGQGTPGPAPTVPKYKIAYAKPTSSPEPGTWDGLPDSTGVIFAQVIPEMEFTHATLPEIAKLLEKESKLLDPKHEGLKFIVLTPKDFGEAEPEPATEIDLSLKYIPMVESIMYVAHLFDQAIKWDEDTICYIPAYGDFLEKWKRNHPARPSR